MHQYGNSASCSLFKVIVQKISSASSSPSICSRSLEDYLGESVMVWYMSPLSESNTRNQIIKSILWVACVAWFWPESWCCIICLIQYFNNWWGHLKSCFDLLTWSTFTTFNGLTFTHVSDFLKKINIYLSVFYEAIRQHLAFFFANFHFLLS